MRTPLNQIKKIPVDEIMKLRDSGNAAGSMNFATQLISEARACGLSLKDYLTWKLDVRGANDNSRFADGKGGLMNGNDAALMLLSLPVKDDYKNGVTLQAAADTFQTFPGTRIMFPQVVDSVAYWTYRQSSLETVDAIVGNRRTIDGTELLSIVVNDAAADYQFARKVTEGGTVPIHAVKTSETAVAIYKFGLGWQFSYEFERRAAIDIIVPYANRSKLEIERSKVWALTSVLINGDGAYGAAVVNNQSSYNTPAGVVATPGKISYKHLLAWLVARAQAGTPVDTVVGNFDAYLQWLFLFAVPTTANRETDAETLARAGFQVGGVPVLNGVVNFALSSATPANQLIGITKAITSEELTENGSKIEESERSIKNQMVTFVSTENSGFRLPFGDTRAIFDYGN